MTVSADTTMFKNSLLGAKTDLGLDARAGLMVGLLLRKKHIDITINMR